MNECLNSRFLPLSGICCGPQLSELITPSSCQLDPSFTFCTCHLNSTLLILWIHIWFLVLFLLLSNLSFSQFHWPWHNQLQTDLQPPFFLAKVMDRVVAMQPKAWLSYLIWLSHSSHYWICSPESKCFLLKVAPEIFSTSLALGDKFFFCFCHSVAITALQLFIQLELHSTRIISQHAALYFTLHIPRGVPQASVVGPLIFTISMFLNDNMIPYQHCR